MVEYNRMKYMCPECGKNSDKAVIVAALGLYLVFIAKQQGSRCCSKSLISVTAEVLILNLWSLSREFGFFAALLFFFCQR